MDAPAAARAERTEPTERVAAATVSRGGGRARGGEEHELGVAALDPRRRVGVPGAFYLTLVPVRPRRRGERRSLRTLPGGSLRPGSLAHNPRPRRLSTPTDAFQLHPDVRSYGTTLSGSPCPSSSCSRLSRSSRWTAASTVDCPERRCRRQRATRAGIRARAPRRRRRRVGARIRRVLSHTGPHTTTSAW